MISLLASRHFRMVQTKVNLCSKIHSTCQNQMHQARCFPCHLLLSRSLLSRTMLSLSNNRAWAQLTSKRCTTYWLLQSWTYGQTYLPLNRTSRRSRNKFNSRWMSTRSPPRNPCNSKASFGINSSSRRSSPTISSRSCRCSRISWQRWWINTPQLHLATKDSRIQWARIQWHYLLIWIRVYLILGNKPPLAKISRIHPTPPALHCTSSPLYGMLPLTIRTKTCSAKRSTTSLIRI